MNEAQSSGAKTTIAGYLADFSNLLQRIDQGAVERIFECLRAARDAGATIYVAGNGGSAATASHWVNDLTKGTRGSGRKPVRAMSLSDNISWLTALANDEGYERIFSGQLETFVRPGDVLVVISASGNSPNLVRAVETARSRGAAIVGFLGFDGGTLKDRVDYCLLLPTDKGAYGLVESGHSLLCHVIMSCLAQDRPETESSANTQHRATACDAG